MEFIRLDFGPGLSVRQCPPRTILAPHSVESSPTSPLPAHTDFSGLASRRVLCLLDEDNLRISIGAHALRLSFDLLLRKLSATARGVLPWAVVTARVGDDRRQKYLVQRGWHVVTVPRETVLTVKGPRIKANGDMDLCYLAGSLALKRFEAVLLGSGDGDLCVAIARGIRRLKAAQEIFTLSVPGSTSHRILVANNPSLFDGNVMVGRDVLRPLTGACLPRSEPS